MSTLCEFDDHDDLKDQMYENINFGSMMSEDCDPDYFHGCLEDVTLLGPLSRRESIDSSISGGENHTQNRDNSQNSQDLNESNLVDNENPKSSLKNLLAFPTKLFNLLEVSDQSVVSWLPNGRAFRVNDMDKFVADILPKYFNRKYFVFFIYYTYLDKLYILYFFVVY